MTGFLRNLFEPGTFQYYMFVIVASILIYIILRKISQTIIKRIAQKFDPKALYWKFLGRTVDFILIVVLIFELLSILPSMEDLRTTLLASSALLVAAVGFASQESMGNIISGMFISIFKPFVIGDRIKLHNCGTIGWVEDIDLRHTIIRTITNSRLIVPNSVMNTEVVENSNYEDDRIMNFLDVKITYESDVARAKEIMLEEVLKHPEFLEWRKAEQLQNNVPKANVLVRDIANNCVELRVGVWTKDISASFSVCSDLRLSIMSRFKDENITLYYQTIRFDGQSPA